DGRAYALAAASRRVFAALGVWPRVAARAQPILRVRASDGRAGEGAAPLFLHFDAAEIEEGPMGFMLEDRFLFAALRAAMARDGHITVLSGATVTAQEVGPTGATVTLADGRRLTGRLIAGCDGRGSGTAVRAGIRRAGWDYGQTALVTAIDHDRPHESTAHQYFMPEGPLAILPLPGNRSSIVWTERSATAAAIQALPDPDYLSALAPRVGDFLGAIKLAGDRFTYPLSLSLAERFTAPRLVLVGDAAHGVHPIAGQGLNLGIRDVAALAEVLADAARRGEDIAAPDVLDRYQKWRRFDTTALALGMDAVNRLFSNDSAVLRPLRDLGMGLISRTPALRRAFMRQAAGLSGELPRLMAGERL
ncbi:MAG TPA: FAD-dependent monooxygenase, partial [Paracoccaceae bacterium]|nr:FAD-dependent monooxygenase [Paracoccaceae bacterium]